MQFSAKILSRNRFLLFPQWLVPPPPSPTVFEILDLRLISPLCEFLSFTSGVTPTDFWAAKPSGPASVCSQGEGREIPPPRQHLPTGQHLPLDSTSSKTAPAHPHTHSQHAGSSHPTRMLSCDVCGYLNTGRSRFLSWVRGCADPRGRGMGALKHGFAKLTNKVGYSERTPPPQSNFFSHFHAAFGKTLAKY